MKLTVKGKGVSATIALAGAALAVVAAVGEIIYGATYEQYADFVVVLCLLAGAVLLFTCAVPVVRFFIDDGETIAYGQYFLKIICITCPAISVTMMIISIFQATGQKAKPMLLSLLRKGGLDVPFMFLMNRLAGANGIPWATPIADFLAMTTGLILFIPYWRQVNQAIARDASGQARLE